MPGGPVSPGAMTEPRMDPSWLEQQRRRLRPHRRRARAGQQTGLDPSQQSELPSWLAEQEGHAAAPARRLLSFSVAVFAALLGFGLVIGANTQPASYALVIFGTQALFVLAWTVATRPPGVKVVSGVGLLAAAGADLAAAWTQHPSLAPVGLVTAAALGAGVVGQLLRGAGRTRVTESLSATVLVVIGVICLASLIVLSRHLAGTQSIEACLFAAGVAVVVARLSDVVLPAPRTSPQVSRGWIGVILGAMAGTVAAGIAGSYLVGLAPRQTVIAGFVTAMCAIMADLAVSYVQASRQLEGEPSTLWVARHMQGPLAGFALAAPAVYVLSVLILVRGL
jgi:hypothetical protein